MRQGMIEDKKQIEGRRQEVEMSSQGNEGDRMVMYKKTRMEYPGLN
jgi:hypothetical protein